MIIKVKLTSIRTIGGDLPEYSKIVTQRDVGQLVSRPWAGDSRVGILLGIQNNVAIVLWGGGRSGI